MRSIPLSKLGWLTPKAYAALNGTNGRGAALRQGSAPRPLATPTNNGCTSQSFDRFFVVFSMVTEAFGPALCSKRDLSNPKGVNYQPYQCFEVLWCPEEDSNLHASRRCYLKAVRLPIPPSGQRKRGFRGHGRRRQLTYHRVRCDFALRG